MHEDDTYLTLSRSSEGLYKEKGSKFLAFAYPADSEEQVKEYIHELKKIYYDARHHCYAFVLKPEEGREPVYRAHDGGEPAHSAGDPILGQIRSQQLYDTLVVVIRYFGGTKLGMSGLIQAYKTAAAEAIAHNQIKKEVLRATFSIHFPYTATNEVMQLMQEYQLNIAEQQFGDACYYRLAVARSLFEEVRGKFEKLEHVRLSL